MLDMPKYEILNYDWPCYRITPDYYQKMTTTFMVNNPHGFVLNSPGTGKTISALWASDCIMSIFPGVKTLILSPLSTLYETWNKEIKKHLFARRNSVVLHGSADKRLKLLDIDADYYILNHDGIKVVKLFNEIMKRKDIKIVIVDECTAFSDVTTLRHKSARKLFHDKPIIWGLTGTPIIRGHMAAHGQARLVHPAYTESRSGFQARTSTKTGFRWEPNAEAYDAAYDLLSPAIRIPRRLFYDIPPAIPVPYDIPLSAAQAAAYKALKKELTATLKSGAVIDAVHEGALRLKLLQIACGCVYDGERCGHAVDVTPRINQLISVIEEAKGKVIVFVPFTAALNNLYNRMKRQYPSALINGSVSLGARSKIFKAFQETDTPQVIYADPGTMSHGLTLTRATIVVWYGPTDKAEVYKQAVLRIDRRGQKFQTYSVQFMSTQVEKEVYKRLERNENMEGVLLKMLEGEE